MANSSQNENFSYEEMIAEKNYIEGCFRNDDYSEGKDILNSIKIFIAGNQELKEELEELEKYTLLITYECNQFIRDKCIPKDLIYSLVEKMYTVNDFYDSKGIVHTIKLQDRKKSIDDLLVYYKFLKDNSSLCNKNLMLARIVFWETFSNEVSNITK